MNDEERWQSVKEHGKNWLQEQSNADKGLHLGEYFAYTYNHDLKHIAFSLSRYKFVSKMFCYRPNMRVLELGCNEAVGAVMLSQNMNMEKYVGVDLDADAIAWNRENLPAEWQFLAANFFTNTELQAGRYTSDLVMSLDVIEHIEQKNEDDFCRVITKNLAKDGVVVIGTPNITMDPYASPASKIGHINLYDQKRLYRLLSKYFANVFIFGMNDEIVHTGFAPMACYIFALCTGVKHDL